MYIKVNTVNQLNLTAVEISFSKIHLVPFYMKAKKKKNLIYCHFPPL